MNQHIIRLFLGVFISTVLSVNGLAQSGKGVIKIRTNPDSAIVKINGVRLMKPDSQKVYYHLVDTGVSTYQMWAPTYQLLEGKIRVFENDTVYLGRSLALTKVYRSYRRKEKAKEKIKPFLYIVPPVLVTAFTIEYFAGIGKRTEAIAASEDVVYQTIESYNNAISQTEARGSRDDYETARYYYNRNIEAKNKFTRNQVIKISGSALVGVACFLWAEKMEKKEFIESPKLTNLRWSIDPFTNSFCINLTF